MTIASESVTWATAEAYLKPNGSTGYRCAAEPVDLHTKVARSKRPMDRLVSATAYATCGLGQYRSDGRREPPIVTSVTT